MSIVVSPLADADVEEILDGIRARSQLAAHRVASKIGDTYRLLERSPELGERHPSRKRVFRGVRFTTVKSYRQFVVFYRPVPGGVEIIRVFRGRRNITEIFGFP